MIAQTIQEKQRGIRRPFDVGLPSQLLNIEHKCRSNLFAWRGQFSPQLVEALLKAYADPNSVVLDPFMGSGTVLVESANLNHEAHGFEVNPAAFTIARIYEFCNLDLSRRLRILTEAEQILTDTLPNDLPLFADLVPKTPRRHSQISLAAAIMSIEDRKVRSLLEALLVLVDQNSNPVSTNIYLSRWATIRNIVLSLPCAPKKVYPNLGDARCLPLEDHTVDFVLSSPPYINVINYHANYRDAVESLGWKPLIIAKSEIGANRKFRQNRFLTVVQYCIDMAIVLQELQRVCKPSSRVVLILGRESNVHKTPFYNALIVSRIAKDVNAFVMVFQQERVFQNRFGQSIYEDILHLEPPSVFVRHRVEIEQDARYLAKQVLVEARQRVATDRRHFIEDAIARVSEVMPSPILCAPLVRLPEHEGVTSV